MQELMQSGKREPSLCLQPRRLEHADSACGRAGSGRSKKRCFSDPGLAAHHQRASAVINVVEEAVDQPQFGFAPDQLGHRGDCLFHSAPAPEQGAIVARPSRPRWKSVLLTWRISVN